MVLGLGWDRFEKKGDEVYENAWLRGEGSVRVLVLVWFNGRNL